MISHFDEDQFTAALQQPVVMVDLWATWCGPCRMLAPIVEEIAEEYGDRVTFGKVDVDEDPDLALRYGVDMIPTLLFFKDGVLADRTVGLVSKETVTAKLDQLLG